MDQVIPRGTTSPEGILFRNNGSHTHEGNQFEVASDRVLQKIRQRFPTIYKKEVTSLRTREWNGDTASLVVSLPTNEGTTRPPLPKNRHDIILDGEWTSDSFSTQRGAPDPPGRENNATSTSNLMP
ncbi:hypothetical protein DPMN_093975 [Dreissena polymorpha]|uniref:Uncharacterized protein n=1 Tax=Dreissena polymorpha TaxID=45954 RepID=A0A9D4L582_DREPO|nr:hypothetical protein DPMN_093975 [Dreissena polymorpha]